MTEARTVIEARTVTEACTVRLNSVFISMLRESCVSDS